MMKEQKIPELYLEQFLLDELPEEKKEALSGYGGLDSVLEALQSSNEEILEDYPPNQVAELINARLTDYGQVVEAKGWFTPKRAGMLLAAAVFAIVAGLSPLLLRQDPQPSEVPGEITRIKGMEPSISLYRKVSGTVEELEDGSRARERDLLQIIYNAAGRLYGVIFSIDGRGMVTLHFPSTEDGSILLENSGDTALEFSYQLDDAPLFERFFFITSDTSFTIDTVLDAAKVLASKLAETGSPGMNNLLKLPEELEQKSLILQKEVSK